MTAFLGFLDKVAPLYLVYILEIYRELFVYNKQFLQSILFLPMFGRKRSKSKERQPVASSSSSRNDEILATFNTFAGTLKRHIVAD